MQRLPSGQRWLIERMRALGYDANPKGVCYGVAHMAIQAHLVNDIETFNKRLHILHTIESAQVQASIDAVREKVKKLSADDIEDLLTEEESLILSIPAFLDGVILHQSPKLFPELFEKDKQLRFQNASVTHELTKSKKMEEIENASVAGEYLFSSAYNIDGLTGYFNTLRQAIEGCAIPIAFELRSINHSIVVKYDFTQKSWLMTDANTLHSHQFNSEKEIAEAVSAALSKNGNVVFSTYSYGQKNHADIIKSALNQWAVNEKTSITAENAKLADSNGLTRLTFAIMYRDINLIKSLLEAGANPNQHDDILGSPLLYAIANKDTQIIDLLLPYADDRFNKNDMFDAMLALAIRENLTDLVEILILREDPSINAPDSMGNVPLKLAVKANDLKLVTLLMAHPDIDPYVKYLGPYDSLGMMILHGRYEISSALLGSNKIDANHIMDIGFGYLYLAAQKNDLKMVELLLKHGALPMLRSISSNSEINGLTPLHMAVKHKNAMIVELMLIAAGENPKATNEAGLALLDQVMAMSVGQLSEFIDKKMGVIQVDTVAKCASADIDAEIANLNVASNVSNKNKETVLLGLKSMINEESNKTLYIIDIYNNWKNQELVSGKSNIDVLQPDDSMSNKITMFKPHPFMEDFLNEFHDKKPAMINYDDLRNKFEIAFIETFISKQPEDKLGLIKLIDQWNSGKLGLLLAHTSPSDLDKLSQSITEVIKRLPLVSSNEILTSMKSSPLHNHVEDYYSHLNQPSPLKPT